jgi:hypothetical protein
MPTLKNSGPLLVDKLRGYFDRLPPWLRDRITIRVEKQNIDAKIDDLDPTALESELKQTITDERLRTNRYLGDGAPGSGNDLSALPASHVSEIVINQTGQVAEVTETISTDEQGLVEGPPLQDGTSEQVGDVWVTKKVEAPTFDDKVFQLTREDLIPPEFRALVPQKLEAHTVDGTAALPVLGGGETVRREEQKKVGVKTVSVQGRDMSSPPVITGQKIDPQWNGATLNLEQKIVPAATDIVQPFGMTDASIKPVDGTNALQETWKVDATPADFPLITLHNFDPELSTNVKTEVQIVSQGSAYTPASNLVLDWEDRKIDAKHTQRAVNFVSALPASYTTMTTQQITFPSILTGISFALVALAAANRKEPQWSAGIRASFTIPTRLITTVEFFASDWSPTSVVPYVWAPTDIIFKGISYSLNLNNVLCDTWTNIGVTYASDAYYGNTIDRFSISATSPSATAYINAVGTLQPISITIEKYKRLYVRKTTSIYLQ